MCQEFLIRLAEPIVYLKREIYCLQNACSRQLEYASEVCNPYAMKCFQKIEQIQRNSCRFIFHEYRRDTDTSVLINRLDLDSLYTRWLI